MDVNRKILLISSAVATPVAFLADPVIAKAGPPTFGLAMLSVFAFGLMNYEAGRKSKVALIGAFLLLYFSVFAAHKAMFSGEFSGSLLAFGTAVLFLSGFLANPPWLQAIRSKGPFGSST